MKDTPPGTRPLRDTMRRFGDRSRLVPGARLAGPMPWVIAIMTTLMVIAGACGLTLGNLAGNARADMAGGLTVQIVEGAPQERDRQAELAVAMLSNSDDVRAVRRVPEAELRALLDPWLGSGQGAAPGMDEIPTPALIDVDLRGPVDDRRLDALRRDLAEAAPAARLDAQASWLAPVFEAIVSVRWLALSFVALLAGTSVAAVWLASRSALGTNRETIEILHLLGGTDTQIARIFERSIGFDAALGGVAGLALGAAAVLLLGRQFAALGSGLMAAGGLQTVDWLALAALPLAGVALAMVTARLTIVAALRRRL